MTIEASAPIRLRTNIYKGCQRCGGVLRLERDLDSTTDAASIEYVCLQCGRRTRLADLIALQRARAERHAA